jgi:hypothetical protein
MTNHKSCYRKAHSGTTQFAPCQLCLDQDVCETDYMLGTSLCVDETKKEKSKWVL